MAQERAALSELLNNLLPTAQVVLRTPQGDFEVHGVHTEDYVPPESGINLIHRGYHPGRIVGGIVVITAGAPLAKHTG